VSIRVTAPGSDGGDELLHLLVSIRITVPGFDGGDELLKTPGEEQSFLVGAGAESNCPRIAHMEEKEGDVNWC
jgi:hypothetical protein